MRQNRFVGNTGLGIDVGPAGPTPNDPGDTDGFLNAPVIDSASIRGNVLTVSGFSRPGNIIELYVASPDTSGFGEGSRYIATYVEGSTDDRDLTFGSYSSPLRGLNVGSDTTNRFEFVLTVPADVVEGSVITAVAVGSVSEFAANFTADAGQSFGAPVVDAGENARLLVQQTFTTQGRFTDLDSDSWTATVDYGDNTGVFPLRINPITFLEVGDEYVQTASATFDLQHVYTAPGEYEVLVTVTDDSGKIGQDILTVIVEATPPRIDNSRITVTPTVIVEGGTVTVTGSFEDLSQTNDHTVTVDWGDGSSSPATVDQIQNTFVATHIYLDDNPTRTAEDALALLISVADGSNNVASTTFGLFYVKVQNELPHGLVLTTSTGSVTENGAAVLLNGSFQDAGTRDTHRVTIDWGDGSAPEVIDLPTGVTSFSGIPHVYLNNPAVGSNYTIRVDVTDDDEPLRPISATQSVTVSDVAPANLQFTTVPGTGVEGSLVTLSGSFTDPGVRDGHTVTVNWGDGSAPTTLDLAAGVTVFSGLTHVYGDDDPTGTSSDNYTITVSVSDPAEAAASTSATSTINIANALPSVTGVTITRPGIPGAVSQILENEEVVLTGSYSDPGLRDTHTVTIDWGDGSSSNATVNALTRTFTARHRYLDDNPSGTAIDTYAIGITVTDDDLTDRASPASRWPSPT